MKGLYTVLLLVASNLFMTFAWYGHLEFSKMDWFRNLSLPAVILLSWGLALFEYAFQVPANRIGFRNNGGPFNLVELKTLQEALSIIVFIIINVYVFKDGQLKWNHILGFCLIIAAVFVIFKKW